MPISERTQKARILLLRVLVIALIGVTVYALDVLQKANQTYDNVGTVLAAEHVVAATAQVGDSPIDIPTYDMFKPGNLWALVSKDRTLKGEAGYTLVDIPIAHGDAEKPMKIARNISNELQKLVNAAEADGEALMVSSAYRSLDEQRQILDEFVATQGEAAAATYVLPPGASEHHTGLSVDFSSVSDECANDSYDCSLSQSSAAWLAEHATRYGFILRYPDNKRPITGVGYEPWHYRFVGKPLARAMASTDLTFDEVITQIAPGYAKER